MGLIAVIGKDRIKLRTYNFPSRGNQPEDYNLVVDGEKLGTDRVRTTGGGGKAYTYIKTKEQAGTNQSYWLPGALTAGTEVKLEVEPEKEKPAPKAADAPAAAKAPAAAAKAPAAAAKAPEAPTKAAPQRPAKGKGK